VQQATISLRARDGSRQDNMPVGEFIARVTGRIRTRAGEL